MTRLASSCDRHRLNASLADDGDEIAGRGGFELEPPLLARFWRRPLSQLQPHPPHQGVPAQLAGRLAYLIAHRACEGPKPSGMCERDVCVMGQGLAMRHPGGH